MSLFDSGSKAAKFTNPGDSITGTITAAPYERQATEYGTGQPKFYPSGDPVKDILVPLQTQLHEDANDDGERTVYVSGPRLKRAIADAIRKAGVSDVEVGGTLTVTFTGYDTATAKNPQNPPKAFTAAYLPPSDPLAQQTAPAAPVLTEQQQQQLASLKAMGLPQAQIAAALGVPETALA